MVYVTYAVTKNGCPWRLRHPFTGLFLASRAATEDKNKDATLNITLIREDNRCRETIEVLYKLESPAEQEVYHDGLMEFAGICRSL